jgi:hypothetical protein
MRNSSFRQVGFWHRQFGGGPTVIVPTVFNFPPGNWNWSPPVSQNWKFIAWGMGSPDDGVSLAGGSGAYFEKTAMVLTTQNVGMSVGGRGFVTDTIINIPGQPTCTAGRGLPGSAGVATGGDVNLNGSIGGVDGAGSGGGAHVSSGASGGAGAPGVLPFRGGASPFSPGAGSAFSSGNLGGNGLVIIFAV